jgi:large subunit ribosomal protein L24e
MPQHRECDYCGDDIEPGTGTMFVRTNGTTIHYCSGKCEKNADLGREPRDLEWTEDGGAETGVSEE